MITRGSIGKFCFLSILKEKRYIFTKLWLIAFYCKVISSLTLINNVVS